MTHHRTKEPSYCLLDSGEFPLSGKQHLDCNSCILIIINQTKTCPFTTTKFCSETKQYCQFCTSHQPPLEVPTSSHLLDQDESHPQSSTKRSVICCHCHPHCCHSHHHCLSLLSLLSLWPLSSSLSNEPHFQFCYAHICIYIYVCIDRYIWAWVVDDSFLYRKNSGHSFNTLL